MDLKSYIHFLHKRIKKPDTSIQVTVGNKRNFELLQTLILNYIRRHHSEVNIVRELTIKKVCVGIFKDDKYDWIGIHSEFFQDGDPFGVAHSMHPFVCQIKILNDRPKYELLISADEAYMFGIFTPYDLDPLDDNDVQDSIKTLMNNLLIKILRVDAFEFDTEFDRLKLLTT